MLRQRLVALAIAALLLPAIAAAQYSVRLMWQHDGDDVGSFRLYAGRSIDTLRQLGLVLDPAARAGTLDGLPFGVAFFAVSAVSPSPAVVESQFSNIACVPRGGFVCPVLSLEAPGPVRNLQVYVTEAPPITITLEQEADRFNLLIDGAGSVHLQLVPAESVFDWFKVGGQTSADLPATPTLGGNNDGRSHNEITVTAPVNGWAETDGPAITGISATVAGVTKPLARNGSTWGIAF